jgi:hypothetical protein
MSTSSKRKTKKQHRINVILTDNQFQRLKRYAESKETTMSEAVRELIKKIPIQLELPIE